MHFLCNATVSHMVGYTSTVRDQTKKSSKISSSNARSKAKNSIDKENFPNNANVPNTPTKKITRKKKAKSLTKTAARGSGLSKSSINTTPLQRHNTRPAPKTSPPRSYTNIEAVGDDPFQVLRDLPRTPNTPAENGLSPTSNMYRIDGTVDLIELGGPNDNHFLSPILIRYQSSPNSSPIKPFALPCSPTSSDSFSRQPYPTSPAHATSTSITITSQATPLDDSHLSEVSLGATPQKLSQKDNTNLKKSASIFDLRAGIPTDGAIFATPRKVVVLSGKRSRTFSPTKDQHPDLTLADMLHDLSFGTDDQDEIRVAEDVAEVSKEEFLWSMKSGFEFLKHGRRGRPHKRLVWFELEKSAICWTESGKKKKLKTKRTMPLHEVIDIVYGTATPSFARRNPEPSLCFSIITPKRTLDLECSTEQVRDFWMSRFYLLKILQHELQNP